MEKPATVYQKIAALAAMRRRLDADFVPSPSEVTDEQSTTFDIERNRAAVSSGHRRGPLGASSRLLKNVLREAAGV